MSFEAAFARFGCSILTPGSAMAQRPYNLAAAYAAIAGVAELVDARGLGPRGHKPWGFESLRPHQLFAGTNESSSATLCRCDTEMLRGFDCVHRIPSRSQYSQNRPRMSADRLEKNQRG